MHEAYSSIAMLRIFVRKNGARTACKELSGANWRGAFSAERPAMPLHCSSHMQEYGHQGDELAVTNMNFSSVEAGHPTRP
jgi:hypothetical protein